MRVRLPAEAGLRGFDEGFLRCPFKVFEVVVRVAVLEGSNSNSNFLLALYYGPSTTENGVPVRRMPAVSPEDSVVDHIVDRVRSIKVGRLGWSVGLIGWFSVNVRITRGYDQKNDQKQKERIEYQYPSSTDPIPNFK